MIRRGIGFASLAPALFAVMTSGPASMASPARSMTAASAPVAWVVNESVTSAKGSATPIDTATNTIIRKITIPLPPLDVVITPDGTTAYVSTDGPGLGGSKGYVYPVSTATGTLGKRIKVGVFSAVMALTPNGKTLYVLNERSNTVTPISTATNTAGRPIKVGQDPVAIVFTHGGKTAYVLDSPPNAVSPRAGARSCSFNCPGNVIPINTATNTAGKPITVGPTPGAIVITPTARPPMSSTWRAGSPERAPSSRSAPRPAPRASPSRSPGRSPTRST
jgi:YVTN family beta-propeller protein